MSICKFTPVKSDWFALLYAVFCQLILIIGDSLLLGVFELGDETLDVYCMDAKFSQCRSDGDFIFYDRHEC